MRKTIYLLIMLGIFLVAFSCSDDIADAVYHKTDPAKDPQKSSLTILLKGMEEGKSYIVGALEQSPFNEEGKADEIKAQNLLFQQPVANGKVVFADLMDYYKKTLYFNVYEKGEDIPLLVTHLGNQLQYQVAFGGIEKFIDLQAVHPDVIKKTVIDLTVDESYNDKVMYLVKSEQQKIVESKLADGTELTEDMYLDKVISNEGKAQIMLNTPVVATDYLVYLVAPEVGLAYLKRELKVGDDTKNVTAEFSKEIKKQINVSVVRGNEKLNDHEVYLITEQDWRNKVKKQVETKHGSPEAGTYVEMKLTKKGVVSFEQFCAEGEQRYVVYVPKWETDYYDSYKMENVSLTSDLDTPYEVTIGDAPSETKIVDFTITIAPEFESQLMFLSYACVLDNAANFKEAYDKLVSGDDYQGLYKSEQLSRDVLTVEIKNVEIDLSRDIIVFVPVGSFFSHYPITKRMKASDIQGNSISVIVDQKEARP
ncbi:hypothetical protein [Bacteroides ovatus]|uniref:hypothetical protein n=1 Tax=Bacteroides ovatus TaxID=28116 RepID=UPI0018993AAC|nr:hypothetical protein [Bacteroides ovatus]MDC2623867.1 hypothetical protein [Bacteroides ovatus]MDC2637822.1 hypothetical protein [Bacteroides ovatus]MDC2650853.1 hypothetical protein [Bacteroides ovatus]